MDSQKQQLPKAGRPRRLWLQSLLILGIVMTVTVLAVGGIRKVRQQSRLPPPSVDEDPRRTFVTPFRNVRPEVRYVEEHLCADCHAEHASRYRRHPMGRSLAPVAQAETLERYGTDSRNPFVARGATFQIERRDEKVFHKEVHRDDKGKIVAAVEAEVHYAVGSGRQGRSYLIDRGGYLFESPISWYSRDKGIWDLSPAYEPLFRGFQRPINTDCLFCHSNRVEPIPYTLGHYQ